MCTLNWLARLLAYALARWKMDGDGRGKEREREHAVSNADTNNACFNKTIDLLLSTRKEKEERRKANIIIVTSLLKIFRSRIIYHKFVIYHIYILQQSSKVLRKIKIKNSEVEKLKFEFFFSIRFFFLKNNNR